MRRLLLLGLCSLLACKPSVEGVVTRNEPDGSRLVTVTVANCSHSGSVADTKCVYAGLQAIALECPNVRRVEVQESREPKKLVLVWRCLPPGQ